VVDLAAVQAGILIAQQARQGASMDMSNLLEKIAVVAVTLLIWMVAAHLRPGYEERTGRGTATAIVQVKGAGPREVKSIPQPTSSANPTVPSKVRAS
jgi:hypothetical protein